MVWFYSRVVLKLLHFSWTLYIIVSLETNRSWKEMRAAEKSQLIEKRVLFLVLVIIHIASCFN